MSLSTGVMGLLGMGLTAASTMAQANAAKQQAQAQAQAAEWNAGIMEENAGLQDIMAQQTQEMGKHKIALAREEGRQKIETQRAGYAASGVKVDTGSPLDVIAEQAGKNKYQQDMIQYDADLSAWGYKTQAYNLRQQATMTRATKTSPNQAYLTSLLSGGANLFNQYQSYQYNFGDAAGTSSNYVPLLGRVR